MDRKYSSGTNWLRYKLGSHAFLHSTAKNSQDAWYRASYPLESLPREAAGFEGRVTIDLWCVRLIVTVKAICSLLHQDFVRRHDQTQGNPSIKEWESLPRVESLVDKVLADVEEIGEHQDR
jgi:hypothetical protein